MRLFALLVPLAGCKPLPEAPRDIDALAHFFFLEFDEGAPELITDGGDKLLECADELAWTGAQGAGEEMSGALTDIGEDHRVTVGLDPDVDYSWVNGVYELLPQPGCSVADLEAMYLVDDQPSLFPGQYDAYSRNHVGDKDCYATGDCDSHLYEITIEDKLIGKSLVYTLVIEVRRVVDEVLGTMVVVRTFMPEPGEIGGETDAATFFDQSYQVEVFTPMADGTALHFYGLWNSGGLKGIDPDNPIWENEYLDGLQDWNDRVGELCTVDRALWE